MRGRKHISWASLGGVELFRYLAKTITNEHLRSIMGSSSPGDSIVPTCMILECRVGATKTGGRILTNHQSD